MGKWMPTDVPDRPDLEQDLPLYLKKDIAAFRKGDAEESTLMDCLVEELYASINSAEVDREITAEQAKYLRCRYLYGADGPDGKTEPQALTLADYMKLPYRMEIIPDAEEGGYTVVFPELPGCLTCGETVEEAMHNAEDAKQEWILSTLEDHREVPIPKQIS